MKVAKAGHNIIMSQRQRVAVQNKLSSTMYICGQFTTLKGTVLDQLQIFEDILT
jgi:hypothetical protein